MSETITPEEIEQIEIVLTAPIETDDDYLMLAENFPEDE